MDEVHDMMDDIAEQQDVAREISDAISNPVGFGEDVDEVRMGRIGQAQIPTHTYTHTQKKKKKKSGYNEL